MIKVWVSPGLDHGHLACVAASSSAALECCEAGDVLSMTSMIKATQKAASSSLMNLSEDKSAPSPQLAVRLHVQWFISPSTRFARYPPSPSPWHIMTSCRYWLRITDIRDGENIHLERKEAQVLCIFSYISERGYFPNSFRSIPTYLCDTRFPER